VKSKSLQSLLPVFILITFTPALCRAQAEINPDHFESIGSVATIATTAADRAYGSFFLPFEVQCAGAKLMPGPYSLSIRQQGRHDIVRLTPIKNGARAQSLEVTTTPQVSPEASIGLVIDRSSKQRTLTAIRLGQLGVTLFLQPARVSITAELIPISFSGGRDFASSGD
jgi:hypothetical protein